MDVLNIAAYRFTAIAEPEVWRSALLASCEELGLKGNILLATEGINLSLAGERDAVNAFLVFVHQDGLFNGQLSNLEIKESLSETQPFGRLVVRIEPEIITMRRPVVCTKRAPAVDAATLKNWIDRGQDDDGREIILLDTRNNYEVAIGTFEGAVHLDIERFSEFPDAIAAFKGNGNEDKTFVSFCTGGIRCEKAAIFMNEIGLNKVYQLDGGILKYFEEIGGTHWRGECFVFDERVALDPQLNVTTKHVRCNQPPRTHIANQSANGTPEQIGNADA